MEDTLPLMFKARAATYGDMPLQLVKDKEGVFQPKSFRQVYDECLTAASGLLSLGLKRNELVGVISDNRWEWLVADFAVLIAGSANVPRGRDSMAQEIAFILGFTECRFCFAENSKQLKKITDYTSELPCLEYIILFDDAKDSDRELVESSRVKLLDFTGLMKIGAEWRAKNPTRAEEELEKGQKSDIFTIIFTSGTTGEPKGVMFEYQRFNNILEDYTEIWDIKPGDAWLSILPIWHSFERKLQFAMIDHGCACAYSKAVPSMMMKDFLQVKPHWMGAVPRIWEALQSNIQLSFKKAGHWSSLLYKTFIPIGAAFDWAYARVAGRVPRFTKRNRFLDALVGFFPLIGLAPLKLLGELLVYRRARAFFGGRFHCGIIGGGTTPPQVSRFYRAVGIKLMEIYGLTESCPLLAVRRMNNVRYGCVGEVLPKTEIKILDADGNVLPPGQKGRIFGKGPQLMPGYYKRPEMTAKVITPDGWLDTGDLGMMTWDNEVKIVGRDKDTIVLLGGENLEPVPIEAKIRSSDFVQYCMVVGQDQKYLGAVIVPERDHLVAWAKEHSIPADNYEKLLEREEVKALIWAEIRERISSANGFKHHEHIIRMILLPETFRLGIELSAKSEIRRHKIMELYKNRIDPMFAAV